MTWKKVGRIGVDAGLCWVGDPSYIIGDDASHRFTSWQEFCEKLFEEEEQGVKQWNYQKGHPGLGVSVCTGYGDGEYDVFVKRNSKGTILELKVIFDDQEIEEDDF